MKDIILTKFGEYCTKLMLVLILILGLGLLFSRYKKNELKEVKDQKIENIVVNTYKSRVEVKTPKKVYKKVIPPEAKVVVSDKKSKNLLKKITYKELLPKEQKKSIRIKRMGFYIQPKISMVVTTCGANMGGGIRYFWYGFYGLDFGIADSSLYYGVDRRLGDVWYKLQNVTIGVVRTRDGISLNVGVLF